MGAGRSVTSDSQKVAVFNLLNVLKSRIEPGCSQQFAECFLVR